MKKTFHLQVNEGKLDLKDDAAMENAIEKLKRVQ